MKISLITTITLLTAGLAAAAPVDRMSELLAAPGLVIVAEGRTLPAANALASRIAPLRSDAPGIVPPGDLTAGAPAIVLRDSGENPCLIALSPHRVSLSGSPGAIADILERSAPLPMTSDSEFRETTRGTADDRILIRHAARGLASDELEAIFSRIDSTRSLIARTLGIGSPGAVAITLHESYEHKGLKTSSLADEHHDPDLDIAHLVWSWDAQGDVGAALARMLLVRHGGEPGAPAWLAEGLCAAFSSTPPPHDHATQLSRLVAASEVVAARTLSDGKSFSRTSRRRTMPLAAQVAGLALERTPVEKRLDLWRRGLPMELSVTRLREEVVAASRRAGPPDGTHDSSSLGKLGFQCGFCYAHEGYRIRDGYVSELSAASLAKLATSGCRSISVTPFVGFRSVKSPEIGNVNAMNRRAGTETDEQIIQAMAYARRLGMTRFLKPHLWGHAGWCGDIVMQNEADWSRFFEAYSDFVLHHALIANEQGVEIFSVGNELPGTTLARPDDWRRLIARVRRVYDGVLVYCANWDRELEAITFWDALDAVAVSCYFPLAHEDTPSDADLVAGAHAVAGRLERVAARTGKPVIISELGYAPRQGAWRDPWLEKTGARFDPRAQERCFSAMLGALAGARWCAGVYVWKWPSYLEHAGPAHRGFSPLGKPAERVIREFFADREDGAREETR